MIQNHEEYYYDNQKYSSHLDSQSPKFFKKYADFVKSLSKPSSTFLDVGCGTGTALSILKDQVAAVGIDISKPSIKKAIEKGINCKLYDGDVIPYPKSTFDIVGSFDVLEHTDNPEKFLQEQKRVLKSGGHMIIVCPNFLSITNSYHHHTKGLMQKTKNIAGLVKRAMRKIPVFEKMATIDREDFHPDDDACNVTNPIDIIKWAKNNGFAVEFWSGRSIYSNSLVSKYIDVPFLKLFLGSSFIVLRNKT